MRSIHRLLLCLVVLAGNLGFAPRAIGYAATQPTTNHQTLTAWLDESIDPAAFAPNQPLVVRFDQTMDAASSTMPIITDPFLAGEVTWSDANQTLIFAPQDGFQAGMTYQVYLDPQIASADGALFDPLPHWSLRTLTAPGLVSITPPGGMLHHRQPVIKIAFDRVMDRESVSAGLTVQPPVALEQTWNQTTLELTLSNALELGEHYQFALSGNITDQQGIALGQEAHWDYWVDSFQALSPVVHGKSFDISFNYPVATEASGTPFAIEPELVGTWEWIDQDTVRFSAENYLASIERYMVRVTAPLKDPLGGEYPALEPVEIVPISPVNTFGPENEPNKVIEREAKIWMRFARPVTRASVEAAFSTTPAVSGKFEWASERVTFIPAQPFPADTDVTVRLDVTALDGAGLPLLAKPFEWTFRTVNAGQYFLDEQLTFGQYGVNAQVLDTDGRRAIQYLNAEKKQAAFTLYRIEAGDFAAWYRTHFARKYYYAPVEWTETGSMEKLVSWPVGTDANVQETLLPADLPTGPYLLTITAEGQTADQLLVIITHYKLVLKSSPERLWVWATDFAGNNAKDLHIRLYTEDGSIQREGQTGSDGIFSTSLPKDTKPALVTAMSDDGDLTAAGFSYLWQESEYYWWGWQSEPQLPRYLRGYVYTERPIYRPGQTMHFKAIIRGDDDVHYTLPREGTPALARVLDARGNEVQRQELALNAFGTLNGSFGLGDGAMLGDYTIEVTVAGETFLGTFKVYEYIKPEYKVDLSLDANSYADGDKIKIEVDARYFFDQPVARAKVNAAIYLLGPKTYNRWWEEVDFQTGPLQTSDYYWHEKMRTLQGQTADENGHATLTFTTSIGESSSYYCRSSWRTTLRECYLGIEVSASDGSGQVVTVSKVIRMYSTPVKYTLDSGAWLKRPGEEFPITITAVDMLGRAVADKKLTLSVFASNTWPRKLVNVHGGKTGADGTLVLPVTLEDDGYFEFTLRDPLYNDDEHEISDWVYVSGKSRPWSQSAYGDFQIKAERRQYKPYEKARLMITTPFDGPALLTFERGQVIHTRPVMLTAPLTEVEVEIVPEDAPNIFVVVNAWKGEYQTLEDMRAEQEDAWAIRSLRDARLYRAEVELMVDAGANRLNVDIQADQPSYQPRQEANLTVRVTDAQNQPVRAELSLALVDEAIYSLSDDTAGPIFEAFYGRREHRISTYNSMALYRYLYDSSGRGGGGEDAPPPPYSIPRSNFQDTAFWLPVVRTNANGVANVQVTLPDNLTSWRVVVKAVTAATQVGEATANIVTQKELLVRPLLPVELVTGDSVTLTAMVHNYSDRAQDVTATLDAAGLKLESAASVPVTLPAGEMRPVTWMVTAETAGDVSLTMRAVAGSLEDAVQTALYVQQRAMPSGASQAGEFQGETTRVVVLPPRLLPGSMVELNLSRSIGGSVLEGLEYLTGYPYGCVEQTMSRALPNAAVGRVLNKLGLQRPGMEAQLPQLIDAGLQRLYGYQHDDGGWGWWYDDATDIYQTAWVVFGLSVTKEAGYPVDAQVIERGATYLQEQIADEDMDPRIRAYALYSLARAGYGDRDQTLALVDHVSALDAFSQAALALALQSVGEKTEARKLLSMLGARVQVNNEYAYWPVSYTDGHYNRKVMSSTVRSTALALSAYLQIVPEDDLIPKMVQYLMDERKAQGWGSTNETAYTLLALIDYLVAAQQSEGNVAYQILVNDAPLLEGTFQPGEGGVSIALPVDQMQAGPNLVRIIQTGEGRLYYTLTSRLQQDLPSMDPLGSVQVSRAYVDVETNKLVKRVQPGQLVRVELTIKNLDNDMWYVILEDHLPAGLQAINEKLNNTSHDGGNQAFDESGWEYRSRDFFQWEKYGYNNKEIHGGRVSFFVTNLPKARIYVFRYLARATHAGSFTAMPAEFSAMYDPSAWGRSASSTLKIE